MMTMLGRHLRVLFSFGLSAICLVLYWQPIARAPLLDFDDKVLASPMTQVVSFHDYVQLWDDNVIVDVQPVRDLSYWLEYRLETLLGFHNHQFMNWVLWLGLLTVLFLLLEECGFPLWLTLGLVTYAAIHPVAVNSVAWTSARKHLLSAFFIGIATWSWLRYQISKGTSNNWKLYSYWLTVMGYILSTWAQPISVLFPIWAWFVDLQERPHRDVKSFFRSAWTIFPLAVNGVVVLLVNAAYYGSDRFRDHFSAGGGGKYLTESWATAADRLLILGRYAYQLTTPTLPSICPYDLAMPEGFVGLMLLPLLILTFFKCVPRKEFYRWTLFLGLPIFVVTAKRTQHTGWDTYLLPAMTGWIFLVGFTTQKIVDWIRQHSFGGFLKVLATGGLVSFFIFLGVETRISADAWISDASLWSKALERESYHMAIVANAKRALIEGDHKRAWDLISWLKKSYPHHPDLAYLLGQGIYKNPILSQQQKYLEFEKHATNSPWYQYYWAAYEASQGQYGAGDDRIRRLWNQDTKSAVLAFADNLGVMAANWQSMCEMAHRTGCSTRVDLVRSAIPARRWPASEYDNQRRRTARSPQ